MAEVTRLQPHDPLPERGPYVVVLTRFGEDDPRATVTEIIQATDSGMVETTAAVGADGRALSAAEAEAAARRLADGLGVARVQVVDRTRGARETEVAAHKGDHGAGGEALTDTDPEDGEEGSSISDRPANAGFFR